MTSMIGDETLRQYNARHWRQVYFATADRYPGRVKIGASADLGRRMNDLDARLVVAMFWDPIEERKANEARTQRRFRHLRAPLEDYSEHGWSEWFWFRDDLVDFTDRVLLYQAEKREAERQRAPELQRRFNAAMQAMVQHAMGQP